MRQEAYFCTVKELDELGKNNIPRQLISHTHLNAGIQFSGSRRIWCQTCRSGGSGFCYVDRVSGMLWPQYLGA